MIPLLRSLFNCIKSLMQYISIKQTPKRGLFIVTLLFYTCTGKNMKDHHFDYFVFSQRWLPTACIEYIEKDSPTHLRFCSLPKNFKAWRIHGLWPSQNKSLGPFFCNKSMTFDIKKVQPLESDLKIYWPNIEGGKGTDSLWQHEWDKHGTCAAELESLNSEIKYFNATLTLYAAYNMQILLNKNHIIPSEKGLSLPYLFYIIKNLFGKMPQVHCIQEVKTKQPYLSEIRLCYNKNLDLIDCKDIHRSKQRLTNGFTNCPTDKSIILPDKADPYINKEAVVKNAESLYCFNKLHDVLLVIQFLQWISI